MMSKGCETCSHKELHGYQRPYRDCKGYSQWSETKGIAFPRLNGLKPTMESCRDKLFEEIGEYLRLTGKGMKASGEQGEAFATPLEMIRELADVAQSAVTQMHIIADEAGIDLDEVMTGHEQKLREKGYLR